MRARDIAHEQISTSTTGELTTRLRTLLARFEKHGYPLDQLRELQRISSELLCRTTGKQSKPFHTWVVAPQAVVALLDLAKEDWEA